MKIENIIAEEDIRVGDRGMPGPMTKPAETVIASVQQEAGNLMDAISNGKWKYAESLLTHMLQQVQNLGREEPSAPSLDRPRRKI